MNTRASAALTLAGSPRKLTGIVPFELTERVIPITLKLGEGLVSGRAHVKPFGRGATEVSLRLPRETPAGRYSGEASIGERMLPVSVLIESVVQLRVRPGRSALAIEPAGLVDFDVEVANVGNAAFAVPKTATFDLDDAEGQDRALGRALRATLAPGERRVDRFFEEIRERHGGEARVMVNRGAGSLAPGESRVLQCRLEVPDGVVPGRTYIGAWQLANDAHVFVLDVSRPAVRSQEEYRHE